jgi:DNA-directed RNA polymerase specialized sigma24 family protein
LQPFEELAASELAQWLRKAIQRLPDREAAVFALIHFDRSSRDDVAATLSISPEAVSTLLYKARQNLQSHMGRGNRNVGTHLPRVRRCRILSQWRNDSLPITYFLGGQNRRQSRSL